MTPQTLCQWLGYIFVVIVGVIVSWGIQTVFSKTLLDPVRVELAARERVQKLRTRFEAKARERGITVHTGGEANKMPPLQAGHLGTGLQEWVGTIEIIIYASSVVFLHPEFIAVWFATKYVAAYKTWAEEPVGRTFYNRSLIGSGINIIIGFFTGRAAVWAISRLH